MVFMDLTPPLHVSLVYNMDDDDDDDDDDGASPSTFSMSRP
jgi:hypothetical protein